MSLRQALSTPSNKSRYVRRLFSRIADRYDLITVVLSCGLDRGWKRRLIEAAQFGPGSRTLDLATGTGDLAFLASARGASVVGLDVTWRMLELAAAKRKGAAPRFVRADMLELPFADGSFDVITTGYGLRNVPVLGRALDEIARVLRPDGQFVSLDFDRPVNPVIRGLYLGYLTLVGSTLGLVLHGDPDTYRYIPASLRQYPGSEQVAQMLRARGFTQTDVLPVLGGFMAIHRACKIGVSCLMTVDTAAWSGEGAFTQKLLDKLDGVAEVEAIRVEDAPSSRSEADYNLISNEIFVRFQRRERQEVGRRFGFLRVTRAVAKKAMTLQDLAARLATEEDVGPPDYADEGMVQYLRTERIIPPYQTRGYKLVELVRMYEAGAAPARSTTVTSDQ